MRRFQRCNPFRHLRYRKIPTFPWTIPVNYSFAPFLSEKFKYKISTSFTTTPWRTRGGGGPPFWLFSLAAERQPFATAKGPVLAQFFSLLLFAIFHQKSSKTQNEIMENSPKGILVSSSTNHEQNPWMD